jgi:hypothetical protein
MTLNEVGQRSAGKKKQKKKIGAGKLIKNVETHAGTIAQHDAT